MKIIFFVSILLFLNVEAVHGDSETIAKGRLEKIGLKKVKFTLDQRVTDQTPAFTVRLKEKTTIYGQVVPAESILQIGKQPKFDKLPVQLVDAVDSISLPKGQSLSFQGAQCRSLVIFISDLLQCELAENLKLKNIEIPTGSLVIYDRKKKKNGIAVPVIITSLGKEAIFGGQKYKAKYDHMLKITDSGVTEVGAQEYFEKIYPSLDSE